MLGFSAFGVIPHGDILPENDLSVKDPFWRLMQLPYAPLRYLIELYPYDSVLPVEIHMLPGPIGMGAFGQLTASYLGGVSPVYLSDHHFITEPGDVPANCYFEPVVDNPLQYDMSLIRGDEIGISTPTYGAIEIRNGDGGLDALLGKNWKGRRIVVKAGADKFAYADYATVFDGLCSGIEADDRNIIITVGDLGLRLDKLIYSSTYAGTGGLEGGNDLVGRMKPLAYGKCFNIEPLLVDAANLIYQAHAGSMHAFDAVYDSGVALTLDMDYADILLANPGAGEYATCRATGHIKLGSTPLGRITANIRGDASQGYISQTGAICSRLATTLYESDSFRVDDLDTAAWAKLDTDMPGDIGLYVTEQQTLRSMLDGLLSPFGSYWYFTRYGRLSVGCIDSSTEPSLSLSDNDIESSGAEMVNVMAPSWRISVAYAPVWTVQAEDELVGAASVTQRTFVGNQYRLSTSENRALFATHYEPTERIFYTNLTDKVAADALLERMKRIYGRERRVYRATVHGSMFRVFLSDAVNFKYSRLKVNAPMRVVGISEDAESASTTLELWG
jgi:hypothetical protein